MVKVAQDTSKRSLLFKHSKATRSEVIDLVPYKRMEEDLLVTRMNHYQKFLRIGTRNIYSMSPTERQQVMDAYTNLCRLYVEDFSILSMMFPAYTEDNTVYWREQYVQAREAGNVTQQEVCQNQLFLMSWVEKNLANHEFYFILYGDTREAIDTHFRALRKYVSPELPLEELTPEVVEKVVFKLQNMNTEI